MEQEEPESKWEGKVSVKLRGPTRDQVWPLLEDFFNLHKWFPTLAVCRGVEGVSGQPGCVRYCAGSSIPANGNDKQVVSWSKEKLLSIDSIEMNFTYEIIDGNIGFESYMSTMKLLDPETGDEEDGCWIQWSFTVDPVKGLTLENLISKFQNGLECMARRIEEAFRK